MIAASRSRVLSSLLGALQDAADVRTTAEADLTPHLLDLVPHVRRVREADNVFEGVLQEAYSCAFGTDGDERGQLLEAIAAAVKRHGRMRYNGQIGGIADFIGQRLTLLKASGAIQYEE